MCIRDRSPVGLPARCLLLPFDPPKFVKFYRYYNFLKIFNSNHLQACSNKTLLNIGLYLNLQRLSKQVRNTISMENVFYNTFFKKSQLNQFKMKKWGQKRMNRALNSLCLSFLKSFNKMDIGCIISLYLRSSIHTENIQGLSLIHIWRCRRLLTCRSRWSPYH